VITLFRGNATNSRIVRSMAWLGAPLPIQFAIGIVQTGLIARTLGPEGLGVLAIYFAATALIFGMVSSPGSEAITTYVTRSSLSGKPKDAGTVARFVFVVSFSAGLLAYATLMILGFLGSKYVGLESSQMSLLGVFGITGILSAFQWESNSILRLADKLRISFVAITTGALVRLAIFSIAFANGWGLEAVVYAYIVGAGITAIIFSWGAIRHAEAAGIPGFLKSWNIRVPKEVIHFQILSFGRSSVKSISGNIDILILANIMGLSQLGIFRATRQITDFSKQPFSLLTIGLQTEYSRKWYKADLKGFRKIAFGTTFLTFLVAGIGYSILIIFRAKITELVLGPGFDQVADLLLILVPALFLATGTSAFTVLPAAVGKAAPIFWAGIVALIAQLVVILLAVPTHGLTGAAWAIAIYSYVIAAVIIPFVLYTLKTGPKPTDILRSPNNV
jgi:O-antigen/teichoic acid export membrane protein